MSTNTAHHRPSAPHVTAPQASACGTARALVLASQGGAGEIDAAIAHVRGENPDAPVRVVLVIGYGLLPGQSEPPCGIAVVPARYDGRSAWISKNRLVATGGARGELAGQLGRARALGATIESHVVATRRITASAAGEPYGGWGEYTITDSVSRERFGDDTIHAIREAMAGRY